MSLKKLPIGYSSLVKIRQENCVYVDKTPFVEKLVSRGGYYFLSRPRRFGKSLFLDTLHQAFLANQAVFKGLYLEQHWDWSIQYPVIRFGFSGASGSNSEELLDALIRTTLQEHAEMYAVDIPADAPHAVILTTLIKNLYKKYQRPVVVLVDEYDKPILDVITEPKQAIANRETLKNLYSPLKELDAQLKFVFLTGVSKFSKVSLFSGLNNLEDISLNSDYADICGYTQSDIDIVFQEYFEGVNKLQLKQWYNGYNFDGVEKQKVYNPFDILLFLSNNKIYKSYWFETGTPTFLIKLLEKNKYYMPSFESVAVSEASLGSIDVESIPFVVLAFQTGYLTIKRSYQQMGRLWYELTYPNDEVKVSLNEHIVRWGIGVATSNENIQSIYTALSVINFNQFKAAVQAFFSSIPHDWYRNNDIQHYEGFYCTIVYSYFCAAGYEVVGEDITNKGQIDLTIKDTNTIFIFEFKVKANQDSAQAALNQIKSRNYADKYKMDSRPIYLIGMVFDSEEKNLVDFVWEQVSKSG